MTDTPGPRHHATPDELDDLQLLRAGLYGPDAEAGPFSVDAATAEAVRVEGRLVVLDLEGVAVVAVEPAVVDAGRVHGHQNWLSAASSRPFEHLQLPGPGGFHGRDVRVVEGMSDLEVQPAAGSALLVLASTSLDGAGDGTELVRAALAVAERTRGVTVHVAPLPPGRPERRSALLRTLGLPDSPPTREQATATEVSGRSSGVVVLLTGLSGSGKSSLARGVAMRLLEQGVTVTLLDGDRVRRHLTAGLGFSPEDRATNVRRIFWVAAEVAHHGGVALCSAIAPSDEVRREVAELVRRRGGRFVLVHVATPLAECERRDRKGLYAAARRGEISDFTGVSAPYDVPAAPDLRIDTTGRVLEECAEEVLGAVTAARSRETRA